MNTKLTANTKRTVLVTAHTGRVAAVESARLVTNRLIGAGLNVRVLDSEAEEIGCAGAEVVPENRAALDEAEMIIVLGGDGTLLRAAELARPVGVPLLGVNLGHVGFLAEAEVEDLAAAVDRVVEGRYDVEERMTVDVVARLNGSVIAETWALNEASVEKVDRMLEVVAEIDGRPLSRWGCDGVICATPTGSTAYAFSAGGPVVWPEVEALLLVPNSAHALFARPLVVSPRSTLAVEIVPGTGPGVLWCDGRRRFDVPPAARVEVRRSAVPVRLARLLGVETTGAPFTDRLVAKFELPVEGWRGRVRPP
ncbi:NAD kinase [Sphaerimonospora thailandensis]|uniref:NAD kinase n=1 Tax=Sphaerimonospora thailandensis TaxID=795644 RepID=A0A8J3VYF9_9ACTN|nr:NAD kinase [Sphaerimonospora thailandensis]GIH69994.1 NAD kinase 2 [Sphaerimonospora thailandensis]